MAYLLQGTRLDTVKKFVNSVYVLECVHVPHVIARDGTRVIKQKVSNIWKSTSSPNSYGIPGWPDLLLIQQPCMSSSEWLAWLKWAGTERSFVLFMTSLRCSLRRSTNLYPVSQMYIVDRHLVRNRKQTMLSVIDARKMSPAVNMPFGCCNGGWIADNVVFCLSCTKCPSAMYIGETGCRLALYPKDGSIAETSVKTLLNSVDFTTFK